MMAFRGFRLIVHVYAAFALIHGKRRDFHQTKREVKSGVSEVFCQRNLARRLKRGTRSEDTEGPSNSFNLTKRETASGNPRQEGPTIATSINSRPHSRIQHHQINHRLEHPLEKSNRSLSFSLRLFKQNLHQQSILRQTYPRCPVLKPAATVVPLLPLPLSVTASASCLALANPAHCTLTIRTSRNSFVVGTMNAKTSALPTPKNALVCLTTAPQKPKTQLSFSPATITRIGRPFNQS